MYWIWSGKMDYIGIVRIVMERRTFGVRVRVHVRL